MSRSGIAAVVAAGLVSFAVAAPAPKSGVYELRFSYASRPYNGYRGGTIYARIYRGE